MKQVYEIEAPWQWLVGVDLRLGVRKTMGSRGNCREFENVYPVWKGKLVLSFGIMLLCENASPVGPKLLILRKSQKPHFGVKFSDFYMLATKSNLAASTKENMLNEWIYALNTSIPHGLILVTWLFLYILSCSGSSTIVILTPSDELKISTSWPGISCDIQIDRSSYLLGIIIACSISRSSSVHPNLGLWFPGQLLHPSGHSIQISGSESGFLLLLLFSVIHSFPQPRPASRTYCIAWSVPS